MDNRVIGLNDRNCAFWMVDLVLVPFSPNKAVMRAI